MSDIYGTIWSDVLYGTIYNDSIYAFSGNDVVYAYSGDDVVYASYGDDYVDGGAGSDVLYGSAGYDYLSGYGFTYYEYDSLVGGSEADTFALGDYWGTYYAPDGWYTYGDGYATITDYNYWEGDTIQLSYGDYWNYSSDTYYDYNGNGLADTSIYYGSNLIGVVSDTTLVSYSYV